MRARYLRMIGKWTENKENRSWPNVYSMPATSFKIFWNISSELHFLILGKFTPLEFSDQRQLMMLLVIFSDTLQTMTFFTDSLCMTLSYNWNALAIWTLLRTVMRIIWKCVLVHSWEELWMSLLFLLRKSNIDQLTTKLRMGGRYLQYMNRLWTVMPCRRVTSVIVRFDSLYTPNNIFLECISRFLTKHFESYACCATFLRYHYVSC